LARIGFPRESNESPCPINAGDFFTISVMVNFSRKNVLKGEIRD
jgi:hypothetical protein